METTCAHTAVYTTLLQHLRRSTTSFSAPRSAPRRLAPWPPCLPGPPRHGPHGPAGCGLTHTALPPTHRPCRPHHSPCTMGPAPRHSAAPSRRPSPPAIHSDSLATRDTWGAGTGPGKDTQESIRGAQWHRHRLMLVWAGNTARSSTAGRRRCTCGNIPACRLCGQRGDVVRGMTPGAPSPLPPDAQLSTKGYARQRCQYAMHQSPYDGVQVATHVPVHPGATPPQRPALHPPTHRLT